MKKRYTIVIAALSAVVGCSQLEDQISDNHLQQAEGMTIKAIIEGSDNAETKTTLGRPTDDIYPVYWSEGDEIKILTAGHRTSDGVGTKMSLVSGEGTSVGVFSGEVPVLPDGCRLYYAVYPYTASTSIGGQDHEGIIWEEAPAEGEWDGWIFSNYIVMSMPSVQLYAENSFAKDYNPSFAITTEAATENTELRFKNICGLLQLNFTGDIKVSKITISHNGGNALWGTLLARYRAQMCEPYADEWNTILFNDEGRSLINQKNLLTLDCGDGVQLSETPTEFYFAIPVTTTSGQVYYDGYQTGFFGLEDTFTEDDGFTIRVYDENGEEVYTKVTDADNRIVRSKIRRMPVIDISRRNLVDLSANGTANSYIVRPSSESRFYAGYRGNTTFPVGDIHSVEVLWETNMSTSTAPDKNSVLRSATYDNLTGYITLNTGSVHGNALVAVRDITGKILWSWHIWVTDYNPNTEGATDIYKGAEFMDRNLGALNAYSATNTEFGNSGLRYQWGRKDPIDEVEDLRYKYSRTMPFTSVDMEVSHESGIKEYMVENPTTRVPRAIYDYPAKEWSKVKNENDPCPPGWQVADMDAFLGVVDYISDSWGDWEKHLTFYDDYVTMTTFSNATFPRETQQWTNRNSFIDNTHSYGANGWQYRNEGDRLPVRCQRSSSIQNTEVIDLSAQGTANSYIVEPNKHYKFNASVKGNTSETVGAATRLAYVYMTENRNDLKHNGWSHGHIGGTCDRSVIRDAYYKDGYIYFSTSVDKTYGNVTLAVQDIHHHTLWSWHIWCVDYDPSQDYDVVEWGDEQRKMMKMNLGALSNTPKSSQSLGLMYQWGRKDPYVSAVAYDSNVDCVFLGNYDNAEYNDATSTLLHSVQFPYTVMKAKDESHGDWLAEHNNALWGENKTVYDPCPPGWKVPSRPTWEGNNVSIGWYDGGLNMRNIWYPASGYRYYRSTLLMSVGEEGHYWYSTPKDDNSAYVFYFDDKTIDLANQADPKAQCNPVRCVME